VQDLLIDPLLATGTWDIPLTPGIEISLLPGVADRAAQTLIEACQLLDVAITAAATGRRISLGSDLPANRLAVLAARVLSNPVIERWSHGHIEPAFTGGGAVTATTQIIAIRDLDPPELLRVNHERSLHLDARRTHPAPRALRSLGT
jgi:phosphoribosylformylglycinamidine (FGAM) synthase PurS component